MIWAWCIRAVVRPWEGRERDKGGWMRLICEEEGNRAGKRGRRVRGGRREEGEEVTGGRKER